jgi:hypothetical protein
MLCATALAAVPSLDDGSLANGKYSTMHMLLEKTLLKVDVALIDMRVDKPTQEKFAKEAAGKGYDGALEGRLARIAMDADNAVIQLKFVRDVSLSQWIDGVRESLDKAKSAGLISGDLAKQVSDGLPQWFKAQESRGFKEGDRILYRVGPDSLRTVTVTGSGNVIVDRTDNGSEKSNMVLATYFAPGTDYRELMLRSLVK